MGALQVAGWLTAVVLLWRWRTLATRTGDPGRASVIIPARNEAERLPRLLSSLAASSVAPLEVIVVDDDSSDGTGAVAAAAGATVIGSGGPPDGWTGKTWACETGVAAARGDVLVLLDADTWLAPDALGRLVAALPHDGLLTVEPRHEPQRWFEQLSAIPNLVAVMSAPRAGFGPCLVTTPAALRAAGGFEHARREVVEDIAIAAAFRDDGRVVRCVGGGDALAFRMYDSPAGLVEGWTKNLASGAGRTGVGNVAATALWITAALSAVTTPAAYAAFALQLAWMLRRIGRFSWWTWAAYPITVLAFVGLFAVSVVRRARGRVAWRGRTIELRR